MRAIYSKYIIRKVCFFLLTTLSVLISIIWLLQSLRLMDILTKGSVTFFEFLQLTALLLVPILYIVIPVALFIATLLALFSMESNNEVIALKSVGVSNKEIWYAVLPVSIVVFIIHLAISTYILPVSYSNFYSMQRSMRDKVITAALEEGVFNTDVKNLTFYVGKKVAPYLYHDILIHDMRNKNKRITITAKAGTIVPMAHGIGFVLKDGSNQIEDVPKQEISIGFFSEYSVSFDSGAVEQTQSKTTNEMFLPELFASQGKSNSIHMQHVAHAMQRINWPVLCIILPIVSIFLGLRSTGARNKHISRYAMVSIAVTAIISVVLLSNNIAWAGYSAAFICQLFYIIICLLILNSKSLDR